jgi:uncharacterized protein (DUF302 family)
MLVPVKRTCQETSAGRIGIGLCQGDPLWHPLGSFCLKWTDLMERNEMTEKATIVVDYREEGRQHDSFQHLRIVDLSFDDVLARLRKAIQNEDIMVLHEVDAQAILGKSNYKIGPARQILFFHPRIMARLLHGDTSALLEAPLKFSVIGSGDKVFVRWQDPAPNFARYGSETLTELGNELSAVCKRIADAALGGK